MNRKKYMKSCEISEVREVVLGGYSQKIAIEGRSKNLPVVLFLHGGPGSPIPFSVGCRGLFRDITDRVIAVYWDQLGCGINNRPIDEGFSIGDFVKMTCDLIDVLNAAFPENKLFLFGMSWGSVLALRAATEKGKKIDGVVVCGQVLKSPMTSDGAFEAIARSDAPSEKKAFAAALQKKIKAGQSPTVDDLYKLPAIVRKYTDGYLNRSSAPAPVGKIIRGMIFSPDYRFKDFKAVVRNGYAKNESILKELAAIDLSDCLASVDVPYGIFQGETDIVTDTREIAEFVGGLNKPNITCTTIPAMGHFPSEAALGAVFDEIVKLAAAQGGGV